MKLISGIVDSGFFAQSALSAEVATKDSLGRNISETYLTSVDLTPYQTTAGMTAYANSAEVTGTAQYGLTTAGWSEITGGGVTGDFELSAGSGISIEDFPLEQKTVISVTAQGGNTAAEQAVIDNSATWNDVTAKADITAIPSLEGYATENWVTSQGYITNDAITGKQDITGMTAYATVESLTAKQDAGNYLSASDSANFLLTSDSGNFYPSDNPSAFITGVDLTPYQLTADMTAYQSAGDYLTTADSANFYTTANESGFITGVPDTYLQNTDLSTEDGKVTAISGIPLSAGGEVPEGVMVESGLEYNAVNEISAYNGSAIAQYGAEKQWIVTDDTLLTLSNSAQFAIGVNISAVQQLMGIDETELLNSTATSAFTLTEPLSGFKAVKIKLRWWDKVPDNYYDVERFTTGKLSLSWTYFDNISDPGPLELVGASWTSNNGINYNLEAGFARVFATGTTAISNFTHTPWPLSIVGVGRIN